MGYTQQGSQTENKSSLAHRNISTVGVDIGDWVCEKRSRSSSSHGPVVFRTWDFGGQREYYATHQYFLSKRSLYLVLWRITDGKRGLAEVLQWLGNIQARAPNSPVIVVGTHYDAVGEQFPAKKAEELQSVIRERFIAIPDAEKMGLPRVLDSIEVSCRTGHNMRLLASLIYETAFSLRSPGSKELLLHQKVPASYVALEDCIGSMVSALRTAGMDPVLDVDKYRAMVTQEMAAKGYKKFRDWSELNQATMFLHDNGVLLHYDDATLRDLYFLEPQWLCDMLAHVVTVREINPFARTGIMRMDDLQLLFKNSAQLGGGAASTENRNYIVSLLNKFEVALTWDARTLLIPSLLPEAEEARHGGGVEPTMIRIASRSKGWALRNRSRMSGNPGYYSEGGAGGRLKETLERQGGTPESDFEILTIPKRQRAISRLLLMSYFPSGFWSRLITRILGDDQVIDVLRTIYTVQSGWGPGPEHTEEMLQCFNKISCQWKVWQTGMALYYGETLLYKIREIPLSCTHSPYRNPQNRFKLKQEAVWCDLDLAATSIFELVFPFHSIGVKRRREDVASASELEINAHAMTQLIALTVDHIDLLLEDWYPTLGTRFVHTSEGRFLVTRLVPCPKCLLRSEERNSNLVPPPKQKMSASDKVLMGQRFSMDRKDYGGLNELPAILQTTTSRKSQDSLGCWSDGDSGVGPDSACSSRAQSVEGHPLLAAGAATAGDTLPPANYCWMIEECILAGCDRKSVTCPVHAEVELKLITPDIVSDFNLTTLIRRFLNLHICSSAGFPGPPRPLLHPAGGYYEGSPARPWCLWICLQSHLHDPWLEESNARGHENAATSSARSESTRQCDNRVQSGSRQMGTGSPAALLQGLLHGQTGIGRASHTETSEHCAPGRSLHAAFGTGLGLGTSRGSGRCFATLPTEWGSHRSIRLPSTGPAGRTGHGVSAQTTRDLSRSEGRERPRVGLSGTALG